MKRMLSYIWPFIRTYQTEHNGTLEVVTTCGKKILESPHAIYSYGRVENIMRFALDKCSLHRVKRILILGLGGGCISRILRQEFNFKGNIDAVEFDKEVIRIAKEEFGIQDTRRLNIYYDDAYHFMCQTPRHYDLIFVDVFIDCLIPSIFLSRGFCQLLKQGLNPQGTIIFNLGINEMQKQEYQTVLDFFKRERDFSFELFNKVAYTNTILVVQKQIKPKTLKQS